jgi:hypothetical protein
MPKLYITEFASPGVAHGGVVPVGNAGGWRENASSPLAITATSTACVTMGVNTTLVRLHTDSTCSVLITSAVTATATANNARMIQNQTEYYAVQSGQVVVVITNT